MSRRKLVSWKALPRSRAGPSACGESGSRIGQHHLADDCRGSVHVAEQVVVGLVRVDRQVHRHRTKEAPEAVGVDVEAADGVHDGFENGVVAAPLFEISEEAIAERRERLLANVGGDVAEVVDDVVGVPAEPVQRVDVVALDLRAARTSTSSTSCRDAC